MTWMNKVRCPPVTPPRCTYDCADQEWLDSINAERRSANLDKVSYETFEIIMDRLEKEWFDLVRTA